MRLLDFTLNFANSDTPFKQQRMAAWQPILTPVKVIAIFLVIGIVFIPVGTSLLDSSKGVRSHMLFRTY